MSCWMRWTIGLDMSCSFRSCLSLCRRRCRGLQRQGVKLFAHPALQGLIDHLMLLDARLAREARRNDGCRIVIAIAAQILDRHVCVRDSLLDQALDLARVHRHIAYLYPWPLINRGRNPSWAADNSLRDIVFPPLTVNAFPWVSPRTWAGTPAFFAASRSAAAAGFARVTRYRAWSSPKQKPWTGRSFGSLIRAPIRPASAISASATSKPPSEMSWQALSLPAPIWARTNSPLARSAARPTAGGGPSSRTKISRK